MHTWCISGVLVFRIILFIFRGSFHKIKFKKKKALGTSFYRWIQWRQSTTHSFSWKVSCIFSVLFENSSFICNSRTVYIIYALTMLIHHLYNYLWIKYWDPAINNQLCCPNYSVPILVWTSENLICAYAS